MWSAGARPAPAAAITPPTERSTSRISSGDRSARQPRIASILSRVPPVWPRPRPDNCGTAAPHAATSGTRTRETLSPTPPVECLSTVGRPTPDRSSRSPDAIIAAVHVVSSACESPRKKIAISSAEACSSATSPAVYACRNQSICSPDRTPPSRLVRMMSMTSTMAPSAARRAAFGERGSARPHGAFGFPGSSTAGLRGRRRRGGGMPCRSDRPRCRPATTRRPLPTAAAGSDRTA